MRVLVGNQRAYLVERICSTVDEGKRILKQCTVTELFIDYFLDGKTTGTEVLQWAFKQKVYPSKITLITNRVHLRNEMAKTIQTKGYVTIDGINYLKK